MIARRIFFHLGFALAATWGDVSSAQVSQTVVVGVTPTCPYGIVACSAGACEGLSALEGVESVVSIPDSYNCTFEVGLREASLPPLDKWSEQFKAVVGEIFVLRGVELTVDGQLVEIEGCLKLQVQGVEEPIHLAPLAHKLQWNFKKRARREPEPAEREAYEQLSAQMRVANTSSFQVQITGPFQRTELGPLLEVREYFLLND